MDVVLPTLQVSCHNHIRRLVSVIIQLRISQVLHARKDVYGLIFVRTRVNGNLSRQNEVKTFYLCLGVFLIDGVL